MVVNDASILVRSYLLDYKIESEIRKFYGKSSWDFQIGFFSSCVSATEMHAKVDSEWYIPVLFAFISKMWMQHVLLAVFEDNNADDNLSTNSCLPCAPVATPMRCRRCDETPDRTGPVPGQK